MDIRKMGFLLIALVFLTSALPLLSSDEPSETEDIIYHKVTNEPIYIPAELINTSPFSELPIPERMKGSWQAFFGRLRGDIPEEPTSLEKAESIGSVRGWSTDKTEQFARLLEKKRQAWLKARPYGDNPPGCDYTTRSDSSHSFNYSEWQESLEAIKAKAVLMVVRVDRVVPAVEVTTQQPVHLVDAQVIEVLFDKTDEPRVPGDHIIFPRVGGPIEILEARYCEWPEIQRGNFESGELVLLSTVQSCDSSGQVVCGGLAFPVRDEKVQSFTPSGFEPVRLEELRALLDPKGEI